MKEGRDKYYIVSKNLIKKTLNEFDVKINFTDVGVELETGAGNKTEHISRLAGLMDFQGRLFKHTLVLSLALSGKNQGVIAINAMREKTIERINIEADGVVERYLEDGIKTRAEERPHD